MLYTRMYCLNDFLNTRGSESRIFVMNRKKKMAGDEDEVPLRDYLTYRVYRIIILQSARVWHVEIEKKKASDVW